MILLVDESSAADAIGPFAKIPAHLMRRGYRRVNARMHTMLVRFGPVGTDRLAR